MRTRPLTSNGPELTVVGLGTWAIGGPWDWGWGPQDDDASIRTIHAALDLGITWIDTAPAYGLGHSEEVVGQAIRGRRDRVFVATKCGLTWDDARTGVVTPRLTAASVRAEAEASLRRLGVDYIDLYQVHWPDPDREIARLVAEGKVRYAGVSNFSPDQVRRAAAIHPVTSHQPPYSMLNRSIEAALLPYLKQADIGAVVYSPMQAGLLTGKFTVEKMQALAKDDWRHKASHFREPRLSAALTLVEGLRPIAAEVGCELAELSVAWTLLHPAVTSSIVGARTPDQIAQTVQAAAVEITPVQAARVAGLIARYEAACAG